MIDVNLWKLLNLSYKNLKIKQFWGVKRLYINIREYYGDIVLAPKVDSLNIVSNTKPLSVVSKPENNSNIEVFSNNDTKANIDEVTFSTSNSDVKLEEK